MFPAETAHHDDRQARRVRHRPAGRGEEADSHKTSSGLNVGSGMRWRPRAKRGGCRLAYGGMGRWDGQVGNRTRAALQQVSWPAW